MEGDRRSVNSELWHACAGPRVSLPLIGSLVVYFPQGHSEQVAASTQKEVDGHIPNYPNLQSQLVCQLHTVALHADVETDEVFAQMTLQPVNEQEKDHFLPPDMGMPNRQPTDFFCKTLTASDTSTHGGFSVPRRAAEKVFPLLDFTKQPPAQELRARDLHDQIWTFRHIYRGQPKRHLLTTGWSVFVSAKRLVAGDSVLFIRDDRGQLLLGIRRANRQQTMMPSSVLSSDSMHIGVLAAAAHAAATSSRFQVFYNPRTSPSEFVIPLAKYKKALYCSQVSVGMRFRMVFETEESTLRRYMGTITGVGDLDSERWPGSKWRNLEVGWDESSAGERPRRVSIWEIEPVSTPFLICPPAFSVRPKRPLQSGLLGDESDMEGSLKRYLTWFRGENGNRDLSGSTLQSLGGDASWMLLQQRESAKPDAYNTAAAAAAALQDIRSIDVAKLLQQPSQQVHFRSVQSTQPSLQQHEQQQSHIMWAQPNVNPPALQNQQQALPQVMLPATQPPQPQTQSQAQVRAQAHPQAQAQARSQTQPLALPQSQPHPQAQTQPLALPQPQPQLQSYSYSQTLMQSPLQSQIRSHIQSQTQPHSHLLSQAKPQSQSESQSQSQSHLQLQPQPQPQSQSQSPSQLQSQPQSLSQSQMHQHQLVRTPTQAPSSHPLVSHQQLYTAHQQHQNPQLVTQQPTSQLEAQRQVLQMSDVPSDLSQASYGRPQVPAARQCATFAEPDLAFEYTPGSMNSLPLQGLLERSHSGMSTSVDNGQLNNLIRMNQSFVQPLHQQQQHHNVPLAQQCVGQQMQQQQQQQVQETMVVGSSSLPPLDTHATGTWYPFSKETSQCESPLLSNVPIGHSDTSSTITSCSFSIPPDPLDNPLILPATTGAISTRFGNSNKEVQCRAVNDSVLGSFPSPSGSFLSAVPDVRASSGMIANGGLEDAVLQRSCSWVPMSTPVRTFTKVHKSGSVGRSIDLSRLKDYDELRRELARMFNLEGQLEDPQRSCWQLVFVDHDGDILLVGDDPWDEFVSCVRAMKILSPAQVLQMDQEGLEQLSTLPMQHQTSSSSEDCHVWRDTCT